MNLIKFVFSKHLLCSLWYANSVTLNAVGTEGNFGDERVD